MNSTEMRPAQRPADDRRGRALRGGAAAPLVIAGLSLLLGCAGGGGMSGPGADLLRAGQYSEAVAALEPQAAARPNDARLKRNLGVARLKAGDAAAAVADLTAARALDASDPLTHFYLGEAAEARQEWTLASESWLAYLERRPGEDEVLTRLREANRKRLQGEIRSALQRENQLAPPPENSLAVMEFKNFSALTDLEPLGKGLTDMITSDLARVERFRVVERTQLNMLVDEIKLGQSTVTVSAPKGGAAIGTTKGLKERLSLLRRKGESAKAYYEGPLDETADTALTEAVRAFQADHGLTADGKPGPRTRAALADAYAAVAGGGVQIPAIDPKSAPRLGRLVAARMLVQGGFAASGDPAALTDATLRIDAGMTETTTGEARGGAADVTGPLSDLFKLERELVYELLHQAGIELTREERDALGRPPTRNVEAFLAYSRGLYEEDRGRYVEAREAYSRAVAIDPGFSRARVRLGGVSGTPDGFSSLEGRLSEQLLTGGAPGGAAGGVVDRLLATGAITGGGLAPGRTGGDAMNPITPPAGAGGGVGTVVVEGEVPR